MNFQYTRGFATCNYQTSYLWATHKLNTAISLYIKYGFRLTEEHESSAFGKPLIEQRFDMRIIS